MCETLSSACLCVALVCAVVAMSVEDEKKLRHLLSALTYLNFEEPRVNRKGIRDERAADEDVREGGGWLVMEKSVEKA